MPRPSKPAAKKAKPAPRKAKAAAPALPTPIAAHKHTDSRVNIPTEELRDFVADDEKTPKTVLYPRDPSLDPQLVWKGKDEQDAAPLEVPAVPIYIQEKIQPQAIIENVRSVETRHAASLQIGLFNDFNGLPFEDLIDFYKHEQHWANRMVLGDSLLVMTSLAEKEGLKGKVQMIYFDPPYGIKFGSNWQVSTRKRDVKDGKAEDATRQPEQIKAFRDTWQLGIHSYLAYLRDRLTAARELLTESGSLFVQIGDENVHLVRSVLDEVFGSENIVSQITFKTTTGRGEKYLPSANDFILWYSKDIEHLKYRQVYFEKLFGDPSAELYSLVRQPDGSHRRITPEERNNPDSLPSDARLFSADNLLSQRPMQGNDVREFAFEGKRYSPGKGVFKTDLPGLQKLSLAGRLWATQEGTLRYIRYLDDFPATPITNIWTDTSTGSFTDPKVYVVQTNIKVIERCLLMTTDPGDLVLDPTCGSGTTAYVAEQWGRRWITIDTSRVAVALARTRLMAARYPYYLLADSAEGRKKELELSGQWMGDDGRKASDGQPSAVVGQDIKRGFVFKRVPHVTLKSIANNEEIDAIHADYQTQMEPLRAQINAALKQNWEEWEIPRELPVGAMHASPLHARWWELRRERQKAIDASIARRADTELLYDQPHEDNKRIRVAGPFTVESLSPHRVMPTDDGGRTTEGESQNTSNFASMIIENLKKAGVQNTVKNERLKFDSLEPFAGVWLQASGEYTESPSPSGRGDRGEGQTKRVAVSIGPEHGTVGPEQVKEAAKEAVLGVGFDLLIVCGFAFDPHVSEEAKRYGKLTVLTARMNPDLAMGDELLKKTGAGNLFMVFGEPDIDVKRVGATRGSPGKITVTLKGVDVYDPTTGQIRSHGTDDIACWFIDSNYNGEAFFVRHAYFTGADAPYEKLKRALRAEIDEAAWSALYQTTSLPFDAPPTGKIAVKVINHYGDEVMAVRAV